MFCKTTQMLMLKAIRRAKSSLSRLFTGESVMTTLIVLGNTNHFTFVNSIIVANDKAIEKFGKPLTNIFVIHSKESWQKLYEQIDWIKYLEDNNISQGLLTEKVVELDSTRESIKPFIDYIELIINTTS